MPKVQAKIKDYVAEHIDAIRDRDVGAADAVVAYAKMVTLEALLECGVSPESAEQKCTQVASNMLHYELFNAYLRN